jgi:tRNA(adenine34) deaminase
MLINFEKNMQLALLQAQKALALGEVPIGAIITDETGAVIGAGYNQIEINQTQTAHAEILALMQAAKKKGDWRLQNCTLYSTLEPCAMCMSAIVLSRVSCVVFAAASPIFGYRVDKQIGFTLYNCPIKIHEGILASDAKALLQIFFEGCRRSNGD